jgi:hypothetical protein
LIYILIGHPHYPAWQDETGFDFWNGYKGDLDVLRSSCATNCEYTQVPGSNDLAWRECLLTDSWFEDFGAPDQGKVAYFLVTGVVGAVESDLGQADRQDEPRSTSDSHILRKLELSAGG